jgi:hypothetical protein
METLTYPTIRLVRQVPVIPYPYPYLLEQTGTWVIRGEFRRLRSDLFVVITTMWCSETQLAQSKTRYNL